MTHPRTLIADALSRILTEPPTEYTPSIAHQSIPDITGVEHLANALDAQSVICTRIDRNTLSLRVLPGNVNVPRYFTIKISEQL